MNDEMLARAYDIIVEECGAPNGKFDKQSFLAYTTTHDDWTEWRFQGKLGFGGKLWQTHWPKYKLYVTYYVEDETDERFEMMQKANKQLEELTSET